MAKQNHEIMNAIRNESTSEYRQMIPEATAETFASVGTSILAFQQGTESFTNMLIDKIVKTIVANRLYKSQLAVLKKSPVPFGKTIENVFIEIIEGKSFEEHYGDSEVSSLLSKEVPSMVPEYYDENIRHKFKVSISEPELKTAFLNQYGLSDLVNKILNNTVSSANYKEYRITKDIISKTVTKEIVIPDYNTMNKQEQAQSVLVACKELIGNFKFVSNKYNPQNVLTHTPSQNVVVFVTPEVKANFDVRALAMAMNIEVANIGTRIIEVDSFEKLSGSTLVADNETLAIVADEDTVQLRETFTAWKKFENGDSLVTNFFHHVWYSAHGCKFTNAVRVKKPVTTYSAPRTVIPEINIEVTNEEQVTESIEVTETE